MMHEGAHAQLLACVSLCLALSERHVACTLYFPALEVPCVRVDAIATLEAVGLPDGSYEIWSTNDAPHDPVPVLLNQSLAEAVRLLSQAESRA
jgi:hypothetical protein